MWLIMWESRSFIAARRTNEINSNFFHTIDSRQLPFPYPCNHSARSRIDHGTDSARSHTVHRPSRAEMTTGRRDAPALATFCACTAASCAAATPLAKPPTAFHILTVTPLRP